MLINKLEDKILAGKLFNEGIEYQKNLFNYIYQGEFEEYKTLEFLEIYLSSTICFRLSNGNQDALEYTYIEALMCFEQYDLNKFEHLVQERGQHMIELEYAKSVVIKCIELAYEYDSKPASFYNKVTTTDEFALGNKLFNTERITIIKPIYELVDSEDFDNMYSGLKWSSVATSSIKVQKSKLDTKKTSLFNIMGGNKSNSKSVAILAVNNNFIDKDMPLEMICNKIKVSKMKNSSKEKDSSTSFSQGGSYE